MNRRDILIFLGVIIWGIYLFFGLPTMSSVFSGDIITTFAISLIVLLVYLVTLVLTSILIPKFGKWGDKAIWKIWE